MSKMTQSDLYAYFVMLSQLANMKPSESLHFNNGSRPKPKIKGGRAYFMHVESL